MHPVDAEFSKWPSEITSELLDRMRRLALRRACAELLPTHSATEAEPHAAPCCTSRQAAAVIDHIGIHEGRLVGRSPAPWASTGRASQEVIDHIGINRGRQGREGGSSALA